MPALAAAKLKSGHLPTWPLQRRTSDQIPLIADGRVAP
jgi:hypothetical protein